MDFSFPRPFLRLGRAAVRTVCVGAAVYPSLPPFRMPKGAREGVGIGRGKEEESEGLPPCLSQGKQ